jgi:uncharacterized protein with PQ loop repeat
MANFDLVFTCGAIGNILFGVKSSFQVVKCYKAKSVSGLSPIMLLFDFFGNICCAYYIFSNTGMKLFWQYINYGCATLFLIILFIMMFVYRESK